MTDSEAAPGVAIDYHRYPDANGHFGRYGGRFVAETLVGPLQKLAAAYDAARVDPAFVAEFETDLKHYVGRPSPVYFAERLTRHAGGARRCAHIAALGECLEKGGPASLGPRAPGTTTAC